MILCSNPDCNQPITGGDYRSTHVAGTRLDIATCRRPECVAWARALTPQSPIVGGMRGTVGSGRQRARRTRKETA